MALSTNILFVSWKLLVVERFSIRDIHCEAFISARQLCICAFSICNSVAFRSEEVKRFFTTLCFRGGMSGVQV